MTKGPKVRHQHPQKTPWGTRGSYRKQPWAGIGKTAAARQMSEHREAIMNTQEALSATGENYRFWLKAESGKK
jgi:hypothetical protein